MKAKVLVLGAVLVAAAILSTRVPREREAAPVVPAATATSAPTDIRQHPALASYRVFEEPATDGVLPYRGANYSAQVSSDGLRFQAGEHRISLRARRIEQGGAALDLAAGAASAPRFAAATVDRGHGVTEEFVFENRRAEHLVRIERPIGEGSLKVRVAVDTNLSGPVQQVSRGDSAWKDMALADGGLAFSDVSGKPALAYHGAVAIDAKGRRQLFDPRWENGEIALELPSTFMKDAAYPVLIDPWLELDFSASGTGVSGTGTVSETPAIAIIGGASPCVAWSDASDGDFDIYFRYWNGAAWTALGSSASAGGVSANDGLSTNPSIGFFTPAGSNLFNPYIAWEDDLSGTTNIYAMFWTGSTWTALGGSASSGGVSLSVGTPCRNPQALSVLGFVENDPTGTVPSVFETFPCIVWEVEGVGIASRFFYPGDNRAQAPPAAWYAHPSGLFIIADGSAARPSASVDSTNQVVVAWEASSGAEVDIFAARSDANTAFTVSNGIPIPGPGGSSWTDLGNVCVDLGLGVALSIQPSLAVDANDDIWVAWQETVGTEREIYAARFSAGWTEVAGSATGGGVSGTSVLATATTSSFPSIAAHPNIAGRPVVAWEDDAGGNPEIYVRRLNGVLSWDEIADEGSALPGNSGGISRTPGFSLRPKVAVAPDGAVTVAWRDGASGTFDLFLRRYHDNSPTSLSQQSINGLVLTSIPVGGTSSSTSLQFSAVLVAESSALAPLRLQVEIRPSTTAFTGQVTHESLEVASGGTATILFLGLPNVNYHWRARSIDALGRGSPWIPFGGNTDGLADFRINSNAVGAGGVNTVVETEEDKDKCGLLGLEALGLLGLLALRRRRAKA